jgi:acetaldehyde dehydrogenase/alcohol dehydrogenase
MPIVKDMEEIFTRIYDYQTPYGDLYPQFAKERDARKK